MTGSHIRSVRSEQHTGPRCASFDKPQLPGLHADCVAPQLRLRTFPGKQYALPSPTRNPTPPHTLYRLDRGRRWPDGTVLASEPLDDDPGWQSIPVGSLVRVDSSGSSVEPL